MKLDNKIYKYCFYQKDRDSEIIVRFDSDSYEKLVDNFKAFSLACEFHAETVNSYMEPETELPKYVSFMDSVIGMYDLFADKEEFYNELGELIKQYRNEK